MINNDSYSALNALRMPFVRSLISEVTNIGHVESYSIVAVSTVIVCAKLNFIVASCSPGVCLLWLLNLFGSWLFSANSRQTMLLDQET